MTALILIQYPTPGGAGPTSWSREALFRLAEGGMNVVRLNMSHGDHASHRVGGWAAGGRGRTCQDKAGSIGRRQGRVRGCIAAF